MRRLREPARERVAGKSCGGPGGRRMYSRRHEEYIADFYADRAPDTERFGLSNFPHLPPPGRGLGICAAKFFKMDRGNFWHAIYRIEQRLGRAYLRSRTVPAVSAGRILRLGRAPGTRCAPCIPLSNARISSKFPSVCLLDRARGCHAPHRLAFPAQAFLNPVRTMWKRWITLLTRRSDCS